MTFSRRVFIGGGLASLVTGGEALAKYVAFDLGAPKDAAVDALINNAIRPGRTPGLSLAVIADGEIRCAGYGLATVDPPMRATPQTQYNIASAGKQFIATGIMLLVQDPAYQFRLDDLVVDHLRDPPQIPPQPPPPSWDKISVRHLLSHTSGLPRAAAGYDVRKDKPDIEVIRASYNVQTLFTPGAAHLYSNLGYFILAEIITRKAGKHWSDFIKDRVFDKAGLDKTIPSNRPYYADGYSWTARHWKLRDRPFAHRAPGPFASTVLDLARWDQVLRTNQILTQTSRDEMFKPVSVPVHGSQPPTNSDYGFGWHITLSPQGTPQVAFHSGKSDDDDGTGGFTAYIRRYLQRDVAVIIATNSQDMEGLGKLSHDIAKIYDPGLP